MKKLYFILYLLIALLVFFRFIFDSSIASGKIVSAIEEDDWFNRFLNFYPTDYKIQFIKNGDTISFEETDHSIPPAHHVGEIVKVIYKTEKPTRAEIFTRAVWVQPLIKWITLSVFSIAIWFIIARGKRKKIIV